MHNLAHRGAAPRSVSWPASLALAFTVAMGCAPNRGAERQREWQATRVAVRLPSHSDGPVHLEDAQSGVAISFTLRGAPSAELRATADPAVFTASRSLTQITYRTTPEGIEDLVAFATPPESVQLTYDVDVSRVPGLRNVGGTVEFLDQQGTPRLRISPPYVRDRFGADHPARMRVDGCVADKDASGPWDRSPTSPGAGHCRVVVEWDLPAQLYPVIVDPTWSTTGSMAAGRVRHQSTLLPNGRVLVTGGYGNLPLASAEIFDPATETWASTADMALDRAAHAAVALPDGRVLVAGGLSLPGPVPLAEGEVYDVANGAWTPTAPMPHPRSSFTLTSLADGRVLAAGGWLNGGYEAAADAYDVGAGVWTSVGSLKHARARHAAVRLSDGRVLVVGGVAGQAAVPEAESFDPASATWTGAGGPSEERMDPTANLLTDGRVLVVGGGPTGGEVYDPASNIWNSSPPVANGYLLGNAAARLPNGDVLIVGGVDETGALRRCRAFNALTGWGPASEMAEPRDSPTATALANGLVLVAGGKPGAGKYHSSAELFSSAAGGGGAGADADATVGGAAGTAGASAFGGTGSAEGAGGEASGCHCALPRPGKIPVGLWIALSGLTWARARARDRRKNSLVEVTSSTSVAHHRAPSSRGPIADRTG